MRKEHDAAIRQPAQELIRAARDQGLDLPDRIEIYVMQSQMPVAYAIGRNSLVIFESLAEQRKSAYPPPLFVWALTIRANAPRDGRSAP